MSHSSLRRHLAAMSPAEHELMETYRPLAGERIVLTGKLDDGMLRDDAMTVLNSWGAIIEGRVSAATDLLVAVEPERRTQKRIDADRYGVKVVDERGLVRFLEDTLIDCAADRSRVAALVPDPPTGFFPAVPEDFEDVITPLSDDVG